MSKFDLRDISDRLTRSKDTEAVVFEFLGYLQAVRSDWRASVAFYEVSRDALVNVYERRGSRLVRRDVSIPVTRLPARLVRKFFHPSAFFNQLTRRTLLSHFFSGSPSFEPDSVDAPALRPIAALESWESCVCLPLADAEDLIGMLVLVSERRNAFGSRVIGDLVPVKSMAAMALAQQLYRETRERDAGAATAGQAASEFQERLQRLNAHASELEQDNRQKAERLEALGHEIEMLDKNSTQYRQELDRVKAALFALEEQSAAATLHLSEAYTELNATRGRMTELQRTVRFMKEVFQLLAHEHEPRELPDTLMQWFCEHFHVERCSLMMMDDARETLSIVAQRGIEPALAARVKVRVGQGISGWVAHNRKPLFVRVREEAAEPTHDHREAYNSDSFICVPLTYSNRVCGVLNLSNKVESEAFDEFDLDRAMLAGSVIAITLGGQDQARRSAAWV